jgi:hypothetical protein
MDWGTARTQAWRPAKRPLPAGLWVLLGCLGLPAAAVAGLVLLLLASAFLPRPARQPTPLRMTAPARPEARVWRDGHSYTQAEAALLDSLPCGDPGWGITPAYTNRRGEWLVFCRRGHNWWWVDGRWMTQHEVEETFQRRVQALP